MSNNDGWMFLGIGSVTLFAITLIISIIMGLSFDKNFNNNLVRASNAATVETASIELNKAIKYLEVNDMTTGSTHVLYATPASDLGYFYDNLKSSAIELEKVSGDKGTQLDKSNALLRFHEVVLTATGEIDSPSYIDLYPSQKAITFFMILAIIGLGITAIKIND